jgi:hypothetical protein
MDFGDAARLFRLLLRDNDCEPFVLGNIAAVSMTDPVFWSTVLRLREKARFPYRLGRPNAEH